MWVELVAIVPVGALTSYLVYVHLSRPSRKECELKHQTERAKDDTIHVEIRRVEQVLTSKIDLATSKVSSAVKMIEDQNSLISRLIEKNFRVTEIFDEQNHGLKHLKRRRSRG